ncbi:hypothetical protein OQA88_11719 [Cercophora sp. LCS_1]
MDHTTPPSPAPSKLESLRYQTHPLLQHNTTALYPHEGGLFEAMQSHSQPTSRHGTPVLHELQSQGYDFQQRGGSGHLQGYHHPMYSHDSSPYGPIPEANRPYSTPATSPPTPSHGSDIVTSRGSAMKDVGSKALGTKGGRVEKTPPKKKKDRAKTAKNVPTLDKPMSELTKDSSIPVADIESYVKRTIDVRRREVESGKNPGRVKRPMNAFMLYRKAYQQRAKEWASQHNHQIVSRVCGLSWPLEPEQVRLQFKEWADLERDNHQKAHPDYKFTPSKPQKGKYRDGKLEDSEGSDLEDPEWGPRGQHRYNRSTTRTPNDDPDPPRSAYSASSFQYMGLHSLGMPQQQNRSAFEYTNPGKPMPSPYDSRDLPGQYYQTQIHNQTRGIHRGMVEDVVMRKTPSPTFAFQSGQSHYGLGHYPSHSPGPEHQNQTSQQPQRFEQRIDPSLLPQEGSMFDGVHSVLFDNSGMPNHHQQVWPHLPTGSESESQFATDSYLPGLEETLSIEQQTQFLRPDDWQIEPLGDNSQFDNSWVDPGHKTEN